MIAIALVSGGLDSLLAANLIRAQGIQVIGLHYKLPSCKLNFKDTFADIDMPIVEIDLADEFLSLICKPRYGFGANMNPCIDCKILMFSKARKLLPEFKASFVVSGEVLGQRPMSQTKQSLELIKKHSGLGDLLLRPLSAGLLAPTLAEREGWVDREKLLKFSGRMRRPQMELASQMGIKKYGNPAGGCLLTDPEFSKRLKELIAHDELNLGNLELLKIGRHFRIAQNAKLIVGRCEEENKRLLELAAKGDHLFYANEDLAGPTSLARGELDEDLIGLCCRISCSYCDTGVDAQTDILYRNLPAKTETRFKTRCFKRDDFNHLRI
ncbi:MAG: tRNA 4-thiouridine(8) synthase ThiI [Candidatus Omnitrophota bacterium]|jgi:tRNA U34 2-thiouridine synthase MnmA/TrmU